MNPFLGILIVAIAFALLMGVVGWLRQRCGLQPELSRKAVHVGMGLVTLSFPWLFQEFWPVGLLAGGFILALLAIRFVPPLRAKLGGVLGGVERESWGEFLFPISVAFIFWLARGNTLLFFVPVLTLSLADALAALIGQRYGLARYALVLVSAAIVIFAWWQPALRDCPANEARWTRQGVVAAVASAIAFGIISLIEPWSKSFL